MDIWEYKVLRYSEISAWLPELNDLGKDGWEVCAVGVSTREILLKRKLNEK